MRVKIPEFATKSELVEYLLKNKQDLIAKKKQAPITSDILAFHPSQIKGKAEFGKKSNEPVQENVDELRVKIVGNTANWIDSHMDMLLPGCWTKSIEERKEIIPHLHDHKHELTAEVGKFVDIFGQAMSYAELGINGMGMTEALIGVSDVSKADNEKIFEKYKNGRINQHSIGLQYLKLDLAINDESSEKEKEFWDKYYPQVINKEVADKRGFFWVVQEIKLIEISAVLFGSNVITPTLDNNMKGEPGQTTPKTEPEQSTQEKTSMKSLYRRRS